MIRPHPTISNVFQLSHDGLYGPPQVGVIGALHGNEPAGLKVIECVKREADAWSARLRTGTLNLIHGNPRASREARRYSQGGTDINRLFAYTFEHDLAREAWTYEHHRALELKPLITGLDAMLDLHSASQSTVPFAICDGTAEGIELARKTGCRVTYGWDGPGMLMEHVSIGALVAAGRPAVSVECGQHRAPDTYDAAFSIMERFLAALGLVEQALPSSDEAPFRLFARVVKPTLEFELAGNYEGFHHLRAGELLGKGDGVTITVDRDAYLLLPTPGAKRGEDIVYLARPDGAQ